MKIHIILEKNNFRTRILSENWVHKIIMEFKVYLFEHGDYLVFFVEVIFILRYLCIIGIYPILIKFILQNLTTIPKSRPFNVTKHIIQLPS